MSDCMIHGDAINMSNERAIEILKPLQKMMCDQHGCPISDAYFAVEKAIRALEHSEKHIALDTGGLISRDALKRSIENAKRLGKNAIDYYINQQPTIDAVPVVHCRDCKYAEIESYWTYCKLEHTEALENEKARTCTSDWFCADGERKDDEKVID